MRKVCSPSPLFSQFNWTKEASGDVELLIGIVELNFNVHHLLNEMSS